MELRWLNIVVSLRYGLLFMLPQTQLVYVVAFN